MWRKPKWTDEMKPANGFESVRSIVYDEPKLFKLPKGVFSSPERLPE